MQHLQYSDEEFLLKDLTIGTLQAQRCRGLPWLISFHSVTALLRSLKMLITACMVPCPWCETIYMSCVLCYVASSGFIHIGNLLTWKENVSCVHLLFEWMLSGKKGSKAVGIFLVCFPPFFLFLFFLSCFFFLFLFFFFWGGGCRIVF